MYPCWTLSLHRGRNPYNRDTFTLRLAFDLRYGGLGLFWTRTPQWFADQYEIVLCLIPCLPLSLTIQPRIRL